jgi:hypothetical protein
MCVRGAFGLSMMCMLATLVYIYTLVSSNRDERRVRMKEKKQFGVVQVCLASPPQRVKANLSGRAREMRC